MGSPSTHGLYNVSLNHSGTGKVTSHKMGKITKNIHGEAEFVVKLQIGDGRPGQPCMVYDECRSFTTFIKTEEVSGLDEVRLMIIARGPRGLKGYFMARREGANIRLFYDRLVSPPKW